MSNLVDSLKIRCVEAGTNITQVCELAGVSRSTIERWKKKPPQSIRILNDLEAVLNQLKVKKFTEDNAEPQFPEQ